MRHFAAPTAFADVFSFFDADGPKFSSWSSASESKLRLETIFDCHIDFASHLTCY